MILKITVNKSYHPCNILPAGTVITAIFILNPERLINSKPSYFYLHHKRSIAQRRSQLRISHWIMWSRSQEVASSRGRTLSRLVWHATSRRDRYLLRISPLLACGYACCLGRPQTTNCSIRRSTLRNPISIHIGLYMYESYSDCLCHRRNRRSYVSILSAQEQAGWCYTTLPRFPSLLWDNQIASFFAFNVTEVQNSSVTLM